MTIDQNLALVKSGGNSLTRKGGSTSVQVNSNSLVKSDGPILEAEVVEDHSVARRPPQTQLGHPASPNAVTRNPLAGAGIALPPIPPIGPGAGGSPGEELAPEPRESKLPFGKRIIDFFKESAQNIGRAAGHQLGIFMHGAGDYIFKIGILVGVLTATGVGVSYLAGAAAIATAMPLLPWFIGGTGVGLLGGWAIRKGGEILAQRFSPKN